MKSTLLIPTLNEIEALRVVMPKLSKPPVDEIIIIDGGSIILPDFISAKNFLRLIIF